MKRPLWDITCLAVDAAVAGTTMAARARANLPDAVKIVLPPGEALPEAPDGGLSLDFVDPDRNLLSLYQPAGAPRRR